MNILHIRSQYITDGGVQPFIAALISHINKDIFNNYITMLTTRDIKRSFFYERLPDSNKGNYCSVEWDKKHLLLPTVRKIAQIIKVKKIDVLHTHDNRANIVAFILIKVMGYRVAWVASAHGWVKMPFKSRIVCDIDKVVIRFADRIHFASETLFNQLWPMPSKKLIAVPYFLDTSHFKARYESSRVRKQWNIPDDSVILGMVGRLSLEKGHSYLLKAMSRVLREFPNTRLIIVGEGPLEDSLKQLSIELGLKKQVTFTGLYPDALEMCSVFDVFVHSSLSESLSIVILEALHLGKPVIATTVGASRDLVVPGENGYLVSPGDVNALADGICRILRDKNKIRRFSAASREIAEKKFFPEVIARQHESLYGELIKGIEKQAPKI